MRIRLPSAAPGVDCRRWIVRGNALPRERILLLFVPRSRALNAGARKPRARPPSSPGGAGTPQVCITAAGSTRPAYLGYTAFPHRDARSGRSARAMYPLSPITPNGPATGPSAEKLPCTIWQTLVDPTPLIIAGPRISVDFMATEATSSAPLWSIPQQAYDRQVQLYELHQSTSGIPSITRAGRTPRVA